jgi:hypothetical protein
MGGGDPGGDFGPGGESGAWDATKPDIRDNDQVCRVANGVGNWTSMTSADQDDGERIAE